MDNIYNLTSQFKDFSELQEYANSQYRLIVDLSRKINDLEAENKHLKILLEGAVPLIGQKPSESIVTDLSDEEVICRTQIKILKDTALDREFTNDEAKKFDIFVKTLLSLKSKEDNSSSKLSKVKDSDLLEVLITSNE